MERRNVMDKSFYSGRNSRGCVGAVSALTVLSGFIACAQ